MPIATSRWILADLAPGDARASRLDVSGLVLHAVDSVADPAFAPAYQFLAKTFGHTGALERTAVLADRFAWPRRPQMDGWTLQYELVSITAADGRIAAVRDHSAAVPPLGAAGERPQVIVHLSHALIAPEWRRTGLGGWLRALPIDLGRECLRASGVSAMAAQITLIAEMEAAASASSRLPASLLAYEKAGFRKLDPARVPYAQPDFRPPGEIDAGGGPRPLPFSLVLRQVGREQETAVDGAAARSLARALYRIYRDGCRADDLAPLLAQVERDYPRPGEPVPLLPPSAA